MARSICSISLPEPIRRYVEKRVRHTGYASVSEYIRDLIRADQQRFEDISEIWQEAPPPPRQQLASAARGHNPAGWKRR